MNFCSIILAEYESRVTQRIVEFGCTKDPTPRDSSSLYFLIIKRNGR